jgi:(2Fe-2S) ferredoxin
MAYYDLHIFCCTNQRPPGAARRSCAEGGAEELRDYMKKKAKELGIRRTRVNTAGCLDRCELGPCMVIYPEGIWYSYKTQADIDDIVASHLGKGEIVERLRLPER